MKNLGNLRAVWLEAFVASVDAGKRTAAGEAVGLDQGTVTKHIQSLERWCRMPLVETGSVPPKLTSAGVDVLGIAKIVLPLLRDIRADPNAAQPALPKVSGKDIIIQRPR